MFAALQSALLAGLLLCLTTPVAAASSSPASGDAAAAHAVRSVRQGAIDFVRVVGIEDVRKAARTRSFWGKIVNLVAGAPRLPFLSHPYGVIEDSLGRLLFTDTELGLVHVLDLEKRRYFSVAGGGGEGFASPVAIAVDASDNIYVADSARPGIFVFDSAGKFLRILTGPSGQELRRPVALAMDTQRGQLFVADTLLHQIVVLDLQGKLVRVIGARGTAPGQFNFPTALALSGNLLYVVDAMNFRVQILTAEGEYTGGFDGLRGLEGPLTRPKGIGVDSDGNIYIADALLEAVNVFDREGRLLTAFGSSGSFPGQFLFPAGLFIAKRDRILVADSRNGRIQIFRYRRVD